VDLLDPFFLGESIKGLQINPELEIQTGVLGYWDFQFKIESLFCLILPLHLLSWQISTSIQIFNYSTETVYPHIHIGHYSVWGSSPDLEEQVPNFLDSGETVIQLIVATIQLLTLNNNPFTGIDVNYEVRMNLGRNLPSDFIFNVEQDYNQLCPIYLSTCASLELYSNIVNVT